MTLQAIPDPECQAEGLEYRCSFFDVTRPATESRPHEVGAHSNQ